MLTKKHYILIVLSFLIFFLAGWKGAEYYYITQGSINGEIQIIQSNDIGDSRENPQDVNLSLYWDVWQELEDYYIDETLILNDQNLVYGSIKGLVDSLDDPYTVFMTPDETKEFEENLSGSLEGVGAELTVENGFLVVVSPLKDSPAEEAGLLPGDIIFQIDGETTGDMTLFDAIMNIRGEKGTEVTLTIIREDLDEPFDITIVRDEITIESVTFEMLEDNVAYVSINQFSDQTSEEFDEAVQKILLNDPVGMILDLRYNGGGYLDISVDILSELIKGEKPVVELKTRFSEHDETFYAEDTSRIPDLPLVVLVNYGSASASEIVAGAIQDHERGIVMGEQTFGKGSVQEVILLDDNSSLRMTIAKWFTPSGRDIDEVGILPDRIIEITPEDITNNYDRQLEEAKSYLVNL